ncbi:MAG: hypothetical protein V3V14_12175, partial [Saprospiraceae bacterium]
MNRRVLILGAGGPAGVNFMRALMIAGNTNVYGTDTNKYHVYLAAKSTKKSYHMNTPKGNLDRKIKAINEIIEENKIELVHAQPDGAVRFLSDNRDKIKSKVFLPDKEVIEKCQNKMWTALIWSEHNLCTEPMSIEVRATLTQQEIAYALDKYGGKMWLRATDGAGGKGSTLVENVETGYSWIRYWRSKDYRKNKTEYQWEWMAQEFLPGRNLAWHSLWKDGELIVSQARERVEYIYPYLAPSGITGTPVVQRTVNDEKVNFVAEQSVLAVDPKPNGIYCVDLRENEQGRPIPTEINAGRFFTTSFFFANAGNFYKKPRANMPNIYKCLALGDPIPKGSKYNILPENLYW